LISRQNDQETEVGQISLVLTKEESENGKAPEFRNVQDKDRSPKT
jgi:hypothetical protein